MPFAAALAMAGQQVDRPGLDALALFRDACVNGEAHLPREHVVKVSAVQLPPDVRVAFGQNLVDPTLLASAGVHFTVSASDDLANTIYELNEGDRTFLVLPINPARKGQPFDRMCAVAVHADRMVDALTAIAPKEAERVIRQQAKGKAAPAYFHGKSGKYDVSIALVNGWTSIATVRPS